MPQLRLPSDARRCRARRSLDRRDLEHVLLQVVDLADNGRLVEHFTRMDSIPVAEDQGLSGYAFRGEIGYGYTPMRCI